MATSGEVEVLDDDRWLYGDGDGIDTGTSEPSDMAAMEALLNEGVNSTEREGTPDLDEIEATSGLNQLPVTKPTSTLQLKTLKQEPDNEIQDNDVNDIRENGDDLPSGGKQDTEEDLSNDDSDDDDDVNITIGTIQNPALFGRAQFGCIPPILGASTNVGTEVVPPIKKVDLETVPQINGVPINEVDIDESIVDKPWRKPGADITDYFNYGFTEETWRLYCEKQRKMRHEVTQMTKLVVTSTMTPTPKIELNKPPMFGFPPPSMELAMLNPNVILPPNMPATSSNNDNQEEAESDGNEERGTPPPDPGVLPPKLPILPPPGLPPTLPFPPPADVNAAAAMAAMFTGGPPPPIRPPDFPPAFPPMHGGLPHFPPPIPGDVRPTFLPPGFNMSGDPPDPRAAGLFNPELGFPPWGDPTMGGHPEIVEHFSQSNDYGGRGSRSPSRSSSGSSRGSSVDRSHSRRDKGRDKYESRSSSRRTRRSRSRERSSHHRSSRRDHRSDHRDRDRDRDRERDRERDRRSDRHEKERRERRRREERRHERSSKRHRSRSPDDDDDREKKRSRSRSAS